MPPHFVPTTDFNMSLQELSLLEMTVEQLNTITLEKFFVCQSVLLKLYARFEQTKYHMSFASQHVCRFVRRRFTDSNGAKAYLCVCNQCDGALSDCTCQCLSLLRYIIAHLEEYNGFKYKPHMKIKEIVEYSISEGRFQRYA